MSTALYEIGGDYGNWGAKVVRDGHEPVVIRNVAVEYDGNDDDYRKQVSLSRNATSEREGKIETTSVRLTMGSKQWIVGQVAYDYSSTARSKTSYARYGTEEWYALIAASFVALYGKRSGAVALTFSMPVNQFRAKVRDEFGTEVKKRDQIAEMLTGTWHVETDDGKQLTYEVMPEHLDIIPEGAGSLAYLCIDPTGKRWIDKTLAESRVVLFDFGGFTLDVLTFDKLKPAAYNESLTSGIIHVRNRIETKLCNKFSLGSIPAPILDEIIQTKQFKFKGGAPLDVSDVVDGALAILMKDALRVWNEELDSGAFFDAVVITGGGGPVLGELLKVQLDHSDVRIIPAGEAHLANALGAVRRRNMRRHMQSQPAAG